MQTYDLIMNMIDDIFRWQHQQESEPFAVSKCDTDTRHETFPYFQIAGRLSQPMATRNHQLRKHINLGKNVTTSQK